MQQSDWNVYTEDIILPSKWILLVGWKETHEKTLSKFMCLTQVQIWSFAKEVCVKVSWKSRARDMQIVAFLFGLLLLR